MKSVGLWAMGLCLLVGGGACKGKEPATDSEQNADQVAPTSPTAADPPTRLPPKAAPKVPKSDESGITWIKNDWESALAKAKTESKPIVIDMWANWCHSCLAMKAGTLLDRGLAGVSGDYVWLAVDTEDPASASVMQLFPPKVWPTFFVVSSVDSSVQATHAGTAAVGEFRDFLERGARGHRAAMESGGKIPKGSALAHLRDGDRAWLEDDHDAAAKHYAAALDVGGEDWPHAAATLKNLIASLAKLEDQLPCATLAQEKLEFMKAQHNSSGVDFMYYASTCAGALPKLDAEGFRDALIKAIRDILRDPDAALSIDDRSSALVTCREVANSLGYQDLAATFALKQRDLLDKAIAESATPLEELTYAWPQVEVYAYLGKAFHILPWIEALEAKLPNEYDPPYRRAWVLFQLEKYEEAHAAVARALSLAKGARQGRILDLDAMIYKAEGNLDKEREIREAIVTLYENLPAGLAPPSSLDRAKQALAALEAKPAASSN